MQVSSVSYKARATFASAEGVMWTDVNRHIGVDISCLLCSFEVLERRVELIAKHCQVVVKFLTRNFRINLGSHNVGVSQYAAYTLDRHAL